MRALLLAAIATLAGASMVYADSAKARRTATVYAKRGERSKVVTTVRSGTSMTVLFRKGRWLKVKVNGRVGWIVRSNVKTGQARDKKDKSKRRHAFVNGRSRKRDLRRRSAPTDRYGLDATGGDDDDDIVLEDDGDTKPVKKSKKPKKKTKKKTKKKKPKKKKAKKKKKSAAKDDEDDDDDDIGDDDDDDIVASDDDDEDFDDEGDDDDDDDEDADDGPEIIVASAEIDVYKKKKKSSEEVTFVDRGEKLTVVERDGDWVRVQTPDNETGWVPAEKLRGGGGSGKYRFMVRGSLGLRTVSQSFSSNDTAETFGNYDIGAKAAMLGAAGEVWYDYSKDYMLAGELDLGYSIATPGIRVEEGTNAADTGFSVFEMAAIGKGGYKLHAGTGTVAFARLGVSYQSFQIKNVRDITNTNLAALPSENLLAPVVGVELAIPALTDKISARAVIDTMLIGASRSQTGGLEDGQVSRAKAFTGSALVTYDYKPNLQLLGAFDYQWAKTNWTGDAMSERKHNATEAERSDTTIIVRLGVSRGF